MNSALQRLGTCEQVVADFKALTSFGGRLIGFAEVAATDQFKNEWVYMDGAFVSTATLWSSLMVADAAARMTQEENELLKADFAALGMPRVDFQALGAEEVSKKLVSFLPLRDIPAVRRMPWWREWLDNWDNPRQCRRNDPHSSTARWAGCTAPACRFVAPDATTTGRSTRATRWP